MKKVFSLILALCILLSSMSVLAEEAAVDMALTPKLAGDEVQVGDQFLIDIKIDGDVQPYMTFRVNGSFTNSVAEVIAPVYANGRLGAITNVLDNENGAFTFEGYDQKIAGVKDSVICSVLFEATAEGKFTFELADDCMLGRADDPGFYALSVSDTTVDITADSDGKNVLIIEDPEPQTPFDVDIMGHWAEKEIVVMYKLGALKGIAEDSIDTERVLTRGEFAFMLATVCKLKSSAAGEPFADVPSDSFYADALRVLKAREIALGDGEGNFMPEQPILWQDAFTLMFRTMKTMNKVDPEIDVDKYIALTEERETISPYALESWAGMLRAKILEPGKNANITVASPGLPMTIAQASYFLNKLAEFNILVSRN